MIDYAAERAASAARRLARVESCRAAYEAAASTPSGWPKRRTTEPAPEPPAPALERKPPQRAKAAPQRTRYCARIECKAPLGAPRRGGVQKYCPACSILRQKEHKAKSERQRPGRRKVAA